MLIYMISTVFYLTKSALKVLSLLFWCSPLTLPFIFYYYFYSDFVAVCVHSKALKFLGFFGALMQSRDGVVCYKELSVREKIEWLSDRKMLVYFEHFKTWDSRLFTCFWWVSLQELLVISPSCDSPKRHWKWKEEVQKSIEIRKTKWYIFLC